MRAQAEVETHTKTAARTEMYTSMNAPGGSGPCARARGCVWVGTSRSPLFLR